MLLASMLLLIFRADRVKEEERGMVFHTQTSLFGPVEYTSQVWPAIVFWPDGCGTSCSWVPTKMRLR